MLYYKNKYSSTLRRKGGNKLSITSDIIRGHTEAIILAQKVIIMSARPGRIKEMVDIDIPYPRTQETKMSPRFMELKNHIWSQVYQEYLEVRK